MLDYVDVPITASIFTEPLPTTVSTPASRNDKTAEKKQESKPSVSLGVLSSLLFSSTIPNIPTTPTTADTGNGAGLILSRQPLSVNGMSTAFRRFIFRGPPTRDNEVDDCALTVPSLLVFPIPPYEEMALMEELAERVETADNGACDTGKS